MSFNLNSKEGTAGISALLIIAIVCAVNFLIGGLSFLNFRVDVTEDKLYTLSTGTKNILDHISNDKPVTIRYYVTGNDRVMPPMLKAYARTVQDLLLEFQKAAKGKIILEKRVPDPNTEDEDKAREDELQGMQVNAEGDHIYLGMAIQAATQKEVLGFLSPTEETALEYNIARSIAKVSAAKRTVIGVASPLPVMGSPMMPFQRQSGQNPWIAIQQLRMDYEVRDLARGFDKVDDDISVLLLIHPSDLIEQSEYAVDQFLLRGGKVIAFVDPLSWVAQAFSARPNPMTGQPGNIINTSSTLPNLFKAWGINFKTSDMVADMNYQSIIGRSKDPTALSLPGEALRRDDRITADLQSLMMMSAGAFEVEKKEGIESVTLVNSSQASQLVDTSDAEKIRREGLATFSASGYKQILGLRLTGKFRTAFPNGRPSGPPASTESGGAQEDANAPKATAPAAPAAAKAPAATPAPAPAPATPAPAPATPAPAPATPVPAPPKAPAPAVEKEKASAPATDKEPEKKDEKKADAPANDGSLKESANSEGAVILFSDADMLFDELCVQPDRLTGALVAANSNLPLVLNCVEIMSGGGDLLQVRSRASTKRPFTRMVEKREAVEKEYRPKLQAKQAELEGIVKEMGPLRVKNGQLLADSNQIKKLEDLQKKQIEISREIREIKKAQNRDVEYTESILTLLNVLGVPLLVIIVGVALAVRRRSATAAV